MKKYCNVLLFALLIAVLFASTLPVQAAAGKPEPILPPPWKIAAVHPAARLVQPQASPRPAVTLPQGCFYIGERLACPFERPVTYCVWPNTYNCPIPR